jgi:hypothetical protein
LVTLFHDANRRVWERAERDGIAGNMGSTLVCCLIFGNRYLVANAGDSRCYYINDHEVRQITADHNQVQDMVRRGMMTEEAASLSPFRHQLTNSLGEPQDIPVDVFPARDAFGVLDEPCVLLLSSDGLHGHVTEVDLLQQVRSTASVPDACASLLNLALARGSTDNVTAVAVEVGELSSRAVSLSAEGFPAIKGPATVKLAIPMTASRRRTNWVPAIAATLLAVIGASLCFPQARDLAVRQLPRTARTWFGVLDTPFERPPAQPKPPPAAGTEGTLGAPASHDGVAPDQPSSLWNANLTCVRHADTFTFEWTPPPGAEAPVTYVVEVSTDKAFGPGASLLREPVNMATFSWASSKRPQGTLFARVTARLVAGGAKQVQRSKVLTFVAPVRQ